jgi:hypothetical protein
MKNGFTGYKNKIGNKTPKNKMSTNAIVNIKNANIDRVTFGEAKRNKSGGIGVSIRYDNQNLQLRLPRMAFPGGLIQRQDEKSGNVSYSLIGSLKGCDPYAKEKSTEDSDMGRLYNFLFDMQEKLVKTATENSSKWFGKKRSEESIRDSLKNIMSVSVDKIDDEYVPNGKYPPSIRIKVPVYDGRVSMDAVDANNKHMLLTVDSLPAVFQKGVEADLVINGSVYVIGQGFGVTWRISFAKVMPQSRLTAANVFADEEEVEEGETQQTQLPVADENAEEKQEEVVPPPQDSAPAAGGRRRRVVVPA